MPERYATLFGVTGTYCHPEADEEAYGALRRLAGRANDAPMALFKEELRRALTHPEEVPEEALYREVQYGDGGAAEFLRRLWRDLYPEEPTPTPEKR
ncbi:hypothetical protein [Actinomadura sp. DC4]|uniref:hypothetical protein n=1 Tax=Actinomadura sp. DC4 TaxID=3055069 RepID=UPI0025AF719F|nr:hypothetical protein [Actinomadura sp. DC4]MDN3359934.1 hypothetical protein [Actinomadura sp. DC4]